MSTEKRRPRPRTGSKSSPARIRAAQRSAKALELRQEGMTLTEIARQLGYRGRQGAADAISRGLQATMQEPADELRRLDLERLDRMWLVHYLNACGGDVWATGVCLKIMERRARLLGLDAPAKVEAKVDATIANGVLVTPGIMALDDWVKSAEKQQADLKETEEALRIVEPRGRA